MLTVEAVLDRRAEPVPFKRIHVIITDPHRLQRFVDAQEAVFATVLVELQTGAKRSHWMWFVFPQVAGLGASAMAQRYAIGSRDEAVAYLLHPLLGPRLAECTRLVMASDRPLIDLLGSPDDLKFHSSMTLFAAAAADAGLDPRAYETALERRCGGRPDARTVAMLDTWLPFERMPRP